MSYRPDDERILLGDTWHCSTGDAVHAFFLQFQKQGKLDGKEENGAIGHAVSKDLLSWKDLPYAIPRGCEGSYDDLEHYTGCTVYHNGMFYLFYTSRSTVNGVYGISLATSVDGLNFEKYPENPLFVPYEHMYYGVNNRPTLLFHGNSKPAESYDLRDLCVCWDAENQLWRGYFVARMIGDNVTETAAIAMCTSQDLIHWEQHPPCFVPGRYHVIETPEVFFMDGKWYMLCLSGNVYGQLHCGDDPVAYNRITFYGVADKMEGPYYEPENSLLIANTNSSAACAKTVLHKGTRYLFYTEVHENDGDPAKEYNYMSVPKVVATDRKGGLCLKWYDGIEAYYENTRLLNEAYAIKNVGQWGSAGVWNIARNTIEGYCGTDWSLQAFAVQAKDFVLETTVNSQSAASAGVWFGLAETVMGWGLAVILDYARNQILITHARTFKILDARSFNFDKDTYRLRVFAHEKTVEVYLDDCFLLHHLADYQKGGIALMTESGNAVFTDTVLHDIKPFQEDEKVMI